MYTQHMYTPHMCTRHMYAIRTPLLSRMNTKQTPFSFSPTYEYHHSRLPPPMNIIIRIRPCLQMTNTFNHHNKPTSKYYTTWMNTYPKHGFHLYTKENIHINSNESFSRFYKNNPFINLACLILMYNQFIKHMINIY